MANADRPRGFSVVGTVSGQPVYGSLRTLGVTDGADMFKGDLITLTSNLAAVSATNDATILGVAVGFGKVDGDGIPLGPYNPVELETLYYDDSASTHTEWVVYYVPVQDAILEVQTNADLDLAVGDPVDLVATAGSTTTGRSLQEVGTNTNSDFVVVSLPKRPDNDNSLTNADVHVTVTRAEQAYS